MKISDYAKAQGWLKRHASSENSVGEWEKYVALNTTPELDVAIKTINDKYGPGTMFPASEAPIPPMTDQQAIFEFGQRNPKADGGQLVAPSTDGLRPGYSGDIEKTLNLIKNKTEPLTLGEKTKLYKSYDPLFKEEYKRLLSLGDPFSKTDLNRAVVNRIVSENPMISLQEGIGLDKIPGGGNEESKTLFERYDKTSARGPLFNNKELANFTQGNATNAMGNTKTQERIFNAILGGNNNKSSLAKNLRISEGRLDYNIEKLMRSLAKDSSDQYIFLKKFKEKDLEKVRNSVFESPSLEQSYQRTISQSILQSTALGSPEREKAFQKLKEFRKFKQVMVENGLDPKLLAMDHAASYRAIKNGNLKNFLSVTPIMKDINTIKSSFDRRSQLNLRRMRDYLLAGDNKNYKYFLKNQTELENLWKTMTGGQSSLGKIRVIASGPQKGKIKIYDYGSTSLLDKNKNLLDELANNLDIRKNIVKASSVKNLDEARRIMLEGSEITERKMVGTLKKTDRAPKTVMDMSFKSLNKPEMFKAEKQIKKLLTSLCPKGKAAASGGRIGYQTAGAVTGTLQCGIDQFNKNLKTGNANSSLMRRILGTGKNLVKGVGGMLNPVEFFKLKNLIGKPAAVAIGLYETWDVADDAIRKGLPWNEAVAENWLFGNVLDMDAHVEEAKNMLDNPNLSPAAKNYAQSIIDIKKHEDLEKKMGWTYGETALKDIESEMATIRHNVNHGGETGRFDYESALADKQDARSEYVGEPKKVAPGYYVAYDGKEVRKVNEVGYAMKGTTSDAPDKIEPRPMKAVVEPAAKRDYFKTLFDMPPSPFMADRGTVQMVPDLKKPVEPDSPVTREEVNRFYQNLGFVHPIGGEVPKEILDELEMEEKTKYWSQLMDQERMRPLGKFASGGRAGYMGGGIAAIRKPNALPPTGGPQSGGLPSLYNNDRKL